MLTCLKILVHLMLLRKLGVVILHPKPPIKFFTTVAGGISLVLFGPTKRLRLQL